MIAAPVIATNSSHTPVGRGPRTARKPQQAKRNGTEGACYSPLATMR